MTQRRFGNKGHYLNDPVVNAIDKEGCDETDHFILCAT
jgi:hypothetical protein